MPNRRARFRLRRPRRRRRLPPIAVPSAVTRAPSADDARRPSPIPSARRGRKCTTPTSSPRPRNALVIVDQHAAHERLVYERLKQAFANGGLSRQMLLIPEVVELDADEPPSGSPARRRARAGSASWSRRSVQARSSCARCRRCSARCNVQGLVRDLADELAEGRGQTRRSPSGSTHVLSTMACHGSVRAGRRLNGRRR